MSTENNTPPEQQTLAAVRSSDGLCRSNDNDEYYDYESGPPVCNRCDGEGVIMICIDDMCHGTGECIHGDGYRTCPNCKGKGE